MNRQNGVMNKDEKEIRIRDYLSGELNREEEREFNQWLERDSDAQRIFKEQVKQEHLLRWARRWKAIDDEIAQKLVMKRVSSRRLRIGFLKYAAVLFLLFTFAFIAWNRLHVDQKPNTLAVISIPEKNVPILKLASGEEISISSSNSKIVHSTQRVDVSLTDSGRLEYVAKENVNSNQLEYNTLVVPQGCEFNLVLADGSRVWLNAGSSLKYPETFSDKERRVYLEGEAYFEVKHDEKTPFIVNTESMDLQVLGTSFNIKAYKEESKIITTLVTGKIRQKFSQLEESITLTPSRQSVFDRNSKKVETQQADIREVLAWKEGKIIANNERLEDIFLQLSRWYDFNVVYTQPSLKDLRFYLHSNRYAEIQTILEHLQTTNGVHFTVVEKTIYVSQ